MKVLILSDLHIGVGTKLNPFGWEQDGFIAMLEKIIRKHQIEQVILNGDIFEMYHFKFNEIIEYNEKLINYFHTKNFVYIRGNHDYTSLIGRDNYVIENSEGKKIYIEHGHKADFLSGTGFGRFIGKAAIKLIRKLYLSSDWAKNIYNRFVEYDDQIYRVPKKYHSYNYLNYALKLLKRYDVVILGHTHKIEAHKTYFLDEKKFYLNCGACSRGRFQAMILDTETLRYDSVKIKRHEDFNSKEKPTKDALQSLDIEKIVKKAKPAYSNPELAVFNFA